MANIKVHGVPVSPATMRVLAALYEKDLPFDLIPVDMGAGAHKQEPHVSLNPFGQIPVFQEGDLTLFESRAITQYIAEEYSENGEKLLCPGCKKVKAITKVWQEVEGQQFDPVASKLVFERIFKGIYGMTTDPVVVEDLEGKLVKVLDIYEARLAKSEFLACDCFTLADLHHLPALHYLLGTESKNLFEPRPKTIPNGGLSEFQKVKMKQNATNFVVWFFIICDRKKKGEQRRLRFYSVEDLSPSFNRLLIRCLLVEELSSKSSSLGIVVGTLLGALTGALIGQETESGFIRGAAIGAISGAVFSIEVFESSLVLWKSNESRFGCLLYLIDVIVSLISGRLVRERIGPAMLSAVQSQIPKFRYHHCGCSKVFEWVKKITSRPAWVKVIDLQKQQ